MANMNNHSQIRDDGYLHALRIYRDHHSKAVRLQASVMRGGMKKSEFTLSSLAFGTDILSSTPVWTAFITDSFLSQGWMRLTRRRYVCLRSLTRHVFSDRYSPQSLEETGEPVLEFLSEYGMDYGL